MLVFFPVLFMCLHFFFLYSDISKYWIVIRSQRNKKNKRSVSSVIQKASFYGREVSEFYFSISFTMCTIGEKLLQVIHVLFVKLQGEALQIFHD